MIGRSTNLGKREKKKIFLWSLLFFLLSFSPAFLGVTFFCGGILTSVLCLRFKLKFLFWVLYVCAGIGGSACIATDNAFLSCVRVVGYRGLQGREGTHVR